MTKQDRKELVEFIAETEKVFGSLKNAVEFRGSGTAYVRYEALQKQAAHFKALCSPKPLNEVMMDQLRSQPEEAK
jgi:hypothetical protein